MFAVLAAQDRPRALALSLMALTLPAAHMAFRWVYTMISCRHGVPEALWLSGPIPEWPQVDFKVLCHLSLAALVLVIGLLRIRNWTLRGALFCASCSPRTRFNIGGDSFQRIPLSGTGHSALLAGGVCIRVDVERGGVRNARAENCRSILARGRSEIGAVLLGFAVFGVAAIAWPAHGQERLVRQSAISFIGALGWAGHVGFGACSEPQKARVGAVSNL